LDDDKDKRDFEDNEIDKIDSKTTETGSDDKDAMKGSSLIQEIETAPAKEEKVLEVVQQTSENSNQDDDWVDESDYK